MAIGVGWFVTDSDWKYKYYIAGIFDDGKMFTLIHCITGN